ncbi:MAG: hypothetical protein JNM89_09415 [Hyphomicrobiaceae bacterium]|nr:hypothetical protein [Hyphomicrobiaceae bacterium]
MSTIDESAIKTNAAAGQNFGLAWAVKRALLGLTILVVMFGGGAWLLYATIDPDRADASETAAQISAPPALLSSR